ncbi:MAG: ABC transporter permease [Bdellovibrionales bacterium]|jgi:ABC-type transport system involved in multi-copper enzyme maturation permease subunit|nr:ABC transporter permease [Bdellovibrionales bacterium]
MRSVLIIAGNTFREVIRDRILYGLIVFALMLLFLSLALGQLTFDENIRLSANFGFTGIHIAIVVLAVFVGSTLVSKEIDKQTILTLLARPISRAQFILGKALGLMGVLLVVATGLSVILSTLLFFLNFEFSIAYPIAVAGIILEAAVLLAVALFFGSFSRPMMTVIFTVSVFLLGHWIDSLHFFVSRSESAVFKFVGTAVGYAIPNLEKFNWRAAPVYGLVVPGTEVLSAFGAMAGWGCILIAATVLIFRRRDFV